jgi:mutual gliding-motility protein MglA
MWSYALRNKIQIIMAIINKIINNFNRPNEIDFKIAYYGPGLAGKTTNIEYLKDTLGCNKKSKIIDYSIGHGHVITFNFHPSILIGGQSTKFTLMTKVGHIYSKEAEMEVLKEANGIIFVADSQIARMYANEEQLNSLKVNLAELNYNYFDLPMVIQLNKRDLKEIECVASMINLFKERKDIKYFSSVAYRGVNVFETLKEVMKQTINKYKLQNKIK